MKIRKNQLRWIDTPKMTEHLVIHDNASSENR